MKFNSEFYFWLLLDEKPYLLLLLDKLQRTYYLLHILIIHSMNYEPIKLQHKYYQGRKNMLLMQNKWNRFDSNRLK